MITSDEAGMLASENQARRNSARRERMRQRGKFDRFGPGADDERNDVTAQRSP